MASSPAYLLLLLSLPFLAAAQSPAPSPSPSTPPAETDPVEILKADGRFIILLELLSQADLVGKIKLQPTVGGLSLLAPTDNAFGKIVDVLEKFSQKNRTTILSYHALDTYVSFSDLEADGKPRATLASGLTLNFTRANGVVNVSTGVVNTVVGSLYDKSPLAIFPVEDVLIPEIFAADLTAPPPPPIGPEPSVAPTPGDFAPSPSGSVGPSPRGSVEPSPRGSATPPSNSAGMLERAGWGGLIAVVLAWMSFSL